MSKTLGEPRRATLTLLVGLPGSGKSTFAKKLSRERGTVRLDGDDALNHRGLDLWDGPARVRVEQELAATAYAALERGQWVVLEWGFWSRAERDGHRDAARARGAGFTMVIFRMDINELATRTQSRFAADPTRSADITLQHLTEWSAIIEWPDDDEISQCDDVSLYDQLPNP